MVSLVPVDTARDLGADIIIAVDVTATNVNSSTNNTMPTINSLTSFWGFLESRFVANTASNASHSSQASTSRSTSMRRERDSADIIIIPNVGHISSLDTSQRRSLMTAGTQATMPQIAAIKQLIKELSLKELSQSKYATL